LYPSLRKIDPDQTVVALGLTVASTAIILILEVIMIKTSKTAWHLQTEVCPCII
jgi:hypothetical protein